MLLAASKATPSYKSMIPDSKNIQIVGDCDSIFKSLPMQLSISSIMARFEMQCDTLHQFWHLSFAPLPRGDPKGSTGANDLTFHNS